MLVLTFLLVMLVGSLATSTRNAQAESGYLAYMDRMTERLDSVWDPARGYYTPGRAGTDTIFNANMLVVHSVAALEGHEGPARRDGRARALVNALLHAPPYVRHAVPHGADSQLHEPGWVNSMDHSRADQHVMIDAEVVDGLTYAWRARRQLGLGDAQADRMAAVIHRVANGRFWRWPAIRLNQINWYARLYAADATVGGGGGLLRHDLALQIHRFAAGANRGAFGNLGPGLHFHYIPHRGLASPLNVDSAEYASIVASFTRFYTQARRAGMAAPSLSHKRLLGQWLTRVLAGYWTHSGYLNWDSGLGFNRWHQAKKLGLSQQGLLGIAMTPQLLPHRRYAAYAKWMFDRGLEFYERQAERARGIAPGRFFGVWVVPQRLPAARLGAARMAGNAARAQAAGLSRRRAVEPPTLYAYDPDIGRLAVTTPTYNTAIIAVSGGAFPYGGIELARLFDGRQEVAANIGGRAPSAFGLLVRDGAGHRLLSTQTPRTRVSRRVTPLRLTRAPAGRNATASSAARRAYAGAFHDLRATGAVSRGGLHARTTHRFTARFIETRWSLGRRGGGRRLDVDVLFPSWGRDVQITAVMADGRQVDVGWERLPLRDVDYLWIRGRRAGYVVVPRGMRNGITARLMGTHRQSSNPHPGPTLALQLARHASVRRAALTARLAPVHDASEAAATAARLRE